MAVVLHVTVGILLIQGKINCFDTNPNPEMALGDLFVLVEGVMRTVGAFKERGLSATLAPAIALIIILYRLSQYTLPTSNGRPTPPLLGPGDLGPRHRLNQPPITLGQILPRPYRRDPVYPLRGRAHLLGRNQARDVKVSRCEAF